MDFLYFQVKAVIEGNYKPERLFGREDDAFAGGPRARADRTIQTAYEDLQKTDELWISKFEAQSGKSMGWKLIDGVLVEQQ